VLFIQKYKIKVAEVLKIDLSGLNDDKIYYKLDKIEQNHFFIEDYLFNQTYLKNPGSYRYINYDLTTSYFVGYRCELSAFGKGKAECRGRRQVLLGVLINDEGYPFKWDVFAGNTAEVNTLKANINACKTRFKLNSADVTLVFDRGIISDSNTQLIEDAGMKYCTLDRNQIASCGIDLSPFKQISLRDRSPRPDGFKKYDDQLYFHDHGVIGNRRFIIGFNPVLFADERKNRKEKIQFFETYLKDENKDLKTARRDRNRQATESRMLKELERLKIKKYYQQPVLHPIVVEKRLKDGSAKLINSFRIQIKQKKDIISADKLLDGVYFFRENSKSLYSIPSARVFRARFLAALNEAVISDPKSVAPKWVVDCIHVGKGITAIKYLSRYLYRGSLRPHRSILIRSAVLPITAIFLVINLLAVVFLLQLP